MESARLFNPTNSCIYVSGNTQGAIRGTENRNNGTYTIFYKKTVVLQTMILANGVLLSEVMWQDDFDNVFKELEDEISVDKCKTEVV